MEEELESVADAVGHVRQFLLDFGDKWTVPRLKQLEDRLHNGDETALVTAVSETTGSMGSLNDVYLYQRNGDDIAAHEVSTVNTRLREMVRDVEMKARSAAAKRGVRLIR